MHFRGEVSGQVGGCEIPTVADGLLHVDLYRTCFHKELSMVESSDDADSVNTMPFEFRHVSINSGHEVSECDAAGIGYGCSA